jgi:hypothetical protein
MKENKLVLNILLEIWYLPCDHLNYKLEQAVNFKLGWLQVSFSQEKYLFATQTNCLTIRLEKLAR